MTIRPTIHPGPSAKILWQSIRYRARQARRQRRQAAVCKETLERGRQAVRETAKVTAPCQ